LASANGKDVGVQDRFDPGREPIQLLQAPSHLAIGLDAVLQAVELPAGVSDLDTGLADVD
jgi:hypothetical protein